MQVYYYRGDFRAHSHHLPRRYMCAVANVHSADLRMRLFRSAYDYVCSQSNPDGRRSACANRHVVGVAFHRILKVRRQFWHATRVAITQAEQA